MNKTLMACVCVVLAASSISAAQQTSNVPMALEIGAQPLDQALTAWAEQTGYQVLIDVERVTTDGITPIVKGSYTPEGALKLLLKSTDLDYKFVNARTVAIRVAAAEPQRETPPGAVSDGSKAARLAQAGGEPHQDSTTANGQQHTEDEVIVTAQKRSERLQDVPVPVAVVSATTLVNQNQLRLQDYYSKTPGVNLLLGTRGEPTVTIRGITTGPGNPNDGAHCRRHSLRILHQSRWRVHCA